MPTPNAWLDLNTKHSTTKWALIRFSVLDSSSKLGLIFFLAL